MPSSTNRRTLLSLATCSLISLWLPPPAHAFDSTNLDLRLVVSDDSETTRRILEAFQKKFPSSQLASNYAPSPHKKRITVFVAIGPRALRLLMEKKIPGVVISVFSSNQAYLATLEAASQNSTENVTALFAESSPANQMRLISSLYKRRVSVGVMVSDKTSYLIPDMRRAATQYDLELSVEHLSSDDNLNAALNRLNHVPVILIQPDVFLHNASTLKNVLLTTYRRNQAVIGFSPSMVAAGALATAFTTIDNMLIQVDEMINEIVSSGRIPEPQFPKYFDVTINESVARSLNLIIDNDTRQLSKKPSGGKL